jgi:hypothetical protein
MRSLKTTRPLLYHLLFHPPCFGVANGILKIMLNLCDYWFRLIVDVINNSYVHMMVMKANVSFP